MSIHSFSPPSDSMIFTSMNIFRRQIDIDNVDPPPELIVPLLHFPLIPLSYECQNIHIAHHTHLFPTWVHVGRLRKRRHPPQHFPNMVAYNPTVTTMLFVIVAAPHKTAWTDPGLSAPAPTDTVALVVRARGSTVFPLSP